MTDQTIQEFDLKKFRLKFAYMILDFTESRKQYLEQMRDAVQSLDRVVENRYSNIGTSSDGRITDLIRGSAGYDIYDALFRNVKFYREKTGVPTPLARWEKAIKTQMDVIQGKLLSNQFRHNSSGSVHCAAQEESREIYSREYERFKWYVKKVESLIETSEELWNREISHPIFDPR